MFERLRETLVTSFVGCVGLGWIFAAGIQSFANIFTAPVRSWALHWEYAEVMPGAAGHASFSWQAALPEVVSCVVLLAAGCGLLCWLYWQPVEIEK